MQVPYGGRKLARRERLGWMRDSAGKEVLWMEMDWAGGLWDFGKLIPANM